MRAAARAQAMIVKPDAVGLEQAVQRLLQDKLVAFPTETVYGLGANASSATAVKKIFAAKGRPVDHPVIVHVADAHALDDWAINIPVEARRLAEACWPGPLTLVLQRATHVPDEVTGSQNTVGLRCPAHPVAQALLRAYATATPQQPCGLAAPSANPYGRISPTTAAHVAADFIDTDLLILDGGACTVGIESTIVDCSRGQPVVLRPGAVTSAMLAQVLGQVPALPDALAPRVSGALPSHYAPRKPLCLVSAHEIEGAAAEVAAQTALLAFSSPVTPVFSWYRSAPLDASDYARHLYANLREMDASAATQLWVEDPPTDAEWGAIADRLTRAAHQTNDRKQERKA
jgi:L-threonylcarbamoyladenylate synthase